MDFFRGKHSWTKLWRLKEQLPEGSRYKAGLMADPDIAEWIVDRLEEDDLPSTGPTFVDETKELQMMRTVLNAVRNLQGPILAGRVKRLPRIEPIRGPVPEWKKVQDRRDQHEVDLMLAYYGIED